MVRIVTFEEIKNESVSQVMKGLEHYNFYVVKPYFEVISSRQEEFVPKLIEYVEQEYQSYLKRDEFSNFFKLSYCVALLAQFKSEDAFDAVCNVFNLDEDDVYDLWEDNYPIAGAMLYRLIGNDFHIIIKLLLSYNHIPFSIGGALVDVLILAYINEQISREKILEIAKSILSEDSAADNEFKVYLMLNIIDLNLYELKEQMIQMFNDENFVEMNVFHAEEFDRLNDSGNYQKEDLDVYKYSGIRYIDNTFNFFKSLDRFGEEYKEYQKILAENEQRNREVHNAKIRAKKAKEKAKKIKASKRKNRKKK